MKYRIGDKVTILYDYDGWDCITQYRKGKDFKNEIGRIINICDFMYDIKILNCPHKNNCENFKDGGYCFSWNKHEIKPINSLNTNKEHKVNPKCINCESYHKSECSCSCETCQDCLNTNVVEKESKNIDDKQYERFKYIEMEE